jgi:hypothetical protein
VEQHAILLQAKGVIGYMFHIREKCSTIAGFGLMNLSRRAKPSSGTLMAQ